MHLRLLPMLASVFTVLIALSFGSLDAVAQETPAAKAARLLNESEFTVTKVESDLWTIDFKGKSMKEITIVVAAGPGIVVSFAQIPESKNVKFSPEVLLKLLKFNDQYDGVKIGIDDKGLLFVRMDFIARTLDKEQLTAGIDQVAAAVDEVHGQIRAHLPKAK